MSQLAVMPSVRLTNRRRAFLSAYFGEAKRNVVEAARMAGFSFPEISAYRLKRELRQVIEQQEVELSEKAQMPPREVVERLSTIARETSHKDHVRALELLAKIHGLLTDKIDVKVERKVLLAEIEQAMGQILEVNPTSSTTSVLVE